MDEGQAYVGLDVHKDTIAVAIADGSRDGEVRFWGNIPNRLAHLHRLVQRIVARHRFVEFVYEAGPCGYDIYRQLSALGLVCRVIAPSHIPRRPGDRVKNDHRDAMSLARLARAGELTAVWVPDPVHEAVRDLVRARHAANRDLRHARQRIQSFLLKYNCLYDKKPWTQRHRTWLANRTFPHAAQQIAFQSYLNAMDQAQARRTQLEEQIRGLLPDWSLAGVVDTLQALRGVALIMALPQNSWVAMPGKPAPQVSPGPFLGLLSPHGAAAGRPRQTGAHNQGGWHGPRDDRIRPVCCCGTAPDKPGNDGKSPTNSAEEP